MMYAQCVLINISLLHYLCSFVCNVVGEEPRLEGTEVEAVLQQLLHETVNELTESFN